MGIWGKLSAPFKGEPNLKTDQHRFKDPYASGYANRGRLSDEATWKLLKDELNRTPGYTDAELRQMREVPIEAQKYGQAQDLRAMNRTAAATGAFGSGGRMEGEGAMRSAGQQTRAGIRTGVAASAAEFARRDRQNQIGMGSNYALARQNIGMQETAATNAWKQHLNEINLQNFLAELAQYNKNYDDGMDMWMKIIGAAAGGACHVAAAVYGGWDKPEVHVARDWVMNRAPSWFRDWYVENAPSVAHSLKKGTLRFLMWRRFFEDVIHDGEPSFYPPESEKES